MAAADDARRVPVFIVPAPDVDPAALVESLASSGDAIVAAKLSSALTSQLAQVASLLASAKTITCTAYSDRRRHDAKLTAAQASAACRQLVKDGFKGAVTAVGKGHSSLVSTGRSRAARAANRRLVITFTF